MSNENVNKVPKVWNWDTFLPYSISDDKYFPEGM